MPGKRGTNAAYVILSQNVLIDHSAEKKTTDGASPSSSRITFPNGGNVIVFLHEANTIFERDYVHMLTLRGKQKAVVRSPSREQVPDETTFAVQS